MCVNGNSLYYRRKTFTRTARKTRRDIAFVKRRTLRSVGRSADRVVNLDGRKWLSTMIGKDLSFLWHSTHSQTFCTPIVIIIGKIAKSVFPLQLLHWIGWLSTDNARTNVGIISTPHVTVRACAATSRGNGVTMLESLRDKNSTTSSWMKILYRQRGACTTTNVGLPVYDDIPPSTLFKWKLRKWVINMVSMTINHVACQNREKREENFKRIVGFQIGDMNEIWRRLTRTVETPSDYTREGEMKE